MKYGIGRLESADNPLVLFRGIVGSRAYGTQNTNSDTDVRGIFAVPSAEYARLVQPPRQMSDERNDRTYYSLVRFCELMAESNPTTMEMLFLPDDCILKTSAAYSLLADRYDSMASHPWRNGGMADNAYDKLEQFFRDRVKGMIQP